jgi:hypothetical protein
VDDGLLLASHKELFDMLITAMERHLPKVHLTQPLQKYVGIEMVYDCEGQSVRCSQTVFSKELVIEVGRAYVL